jgi:hypothetical protein
MERAFQRTSFAQFLLSITERRCPQGGGEVQFLLATERRRPQGGGEVQFLLSITERRRPQGGGEVQFLLSITERRCPQGGGEVALRASQPQSDPHPLVAPLDGTPALGLRRGVRLPGAGRVRIPSLLPRGSP